MTLFKELHRAQPREEKASSLYRELSDITGMDLAEITNIIEHSLLATHDLMSKGIPVTTCQHVSFYLNYEDYVDKHNGIDVQIAKPTERQVEARKEIIMHTPKAVNHFRRGDFILYKKDDTHCIGFVETVSGDYEMLAQRVYVMNKKGGYYFLRIQIDPAIDSISEGEFLTPKVAKAFLSARLKKTIPSKLLSQLYQDVNDVFKNLYY